MGRTHRTTPTPAPTQTRGERGERREGEGRAAVAKLHDCTHHREYVSLSLAEHINGQSSKSLRTGQFVRGRFTRIVACGGEIVGNFPASNIVRSRVAGPTNLLSS